MGKRTVCRGVGGISLPVLWKVFQEMWKMTTLMTITQNQYWANIILLHYKTQNSTAKTKEERLV